MIKPWESKYWNFVLLVSTGVWIVYLGLALLMMVLDFTGQEELITTEGVTPLKIKNVKFILHFIVFSLVLRSALILLMPLIQFSRWLKENKEDQLSLDKEENKKPPIPKRFNKTVQSVQRLTGVALLFLAWNFGMAFRIDWGISIQFLIGMILSGAICVLVSNIPKVEHGAHIDPEKPISFARRRHERRS